MFQIDFSVFHFPWETGYKVYIFERARNKRQASLYIEVTDGTKITLIFFDNTTNGNSKTYL